MNRLIFTLILVAAASLSAIAQGTPNSAVTPEMRQQANTFYQASDWPKAAAAYEKIVELEPVNPGANYRLGLILMNLDRNAEAAKHLAVSMDKSPNPVFALALARAYARTGDKTKAFDVIEKTTKAGGIPPESLTGDKDFAAWQNDPAFKDLVRRSDLASNPCKASPEFRQFDFWIGEWDVRNQQGVPAGSSSIQLMLGQCVIMENWSGLGNSNGKSFNVYDVNDKKWHQTYVDDKGSFTHYIGGLVNGEMVVTADTFSSGKKMLARMTFSKLPNGDVRQHGENSTDDGKTWTTGFDLVYSKKKT